MGHKRGFFPVSLNLYVGVRVAGLDQLIQFVYIAAMARQPVFEQVAGHADVSTLTLVTFDAIDHVVLVQHRDRVLDPCVEVVDSVSGSGCYYDVRVVLL